ncbi:tape measure protein [Sphingobium sp. MK2]|uniref:tape measure protein n=1 Tax=Sphingobium sp. MK2 TaxID=3116540 RepID=UPI0032E362AF
MSTENHGLKFVLDTSGIARGVKQYESAVEGIFASLDKFEDHVVNTMKGVAKAASNKKDIGKFVAGFKQLGDIKVDAKAAGRISALSAAMGGFKAPSAAQIANSKKFFSALGGLPDLTQAYKSVAGINGLAASMAGFKAPSSAMSKRIREFGKAVEAAAPGLSKLKGISGISGVANELATISMALSGLKVPSKSHVTNLLGIANALRAFNFANLQGATGLYSFLSVLSRFKAPSMSQVKNLQAFITAVSNLTIPRNGSQVAKVLHDIAAAAAAASGKLGGFKATLGGFPSSFNSFSNGARSASISMMGLQNAFSGTFQIGSALRTLLGSLTIGELGRNFFQATNSAMTFSAGMGVISKATGFADQQLKYINTTANNFGQDMLGAEEGFMKFAISANKAGASVGQTKNIYEGFSTAMTVLGTSADRQKDVFLALQQVMNKGYLGSEELMQQINEHMPGAIGYLREETKRLGVDLQDALEDKMLNGTQALLFLAKKYRDEFGPSLEEALERPNTQMQILKNNVNSLYQAIGKNGANKAFAGFLAKLNSYLNPEDLDRYATIVGGKLASAMDWLGQKLDYVYQNWDKIKGPLGTTLSLLGKWMVISGSLQIGKALVAPLWGGYQAASALIPKMGQLLTLMKAMTTMSIVTPLASGGGAALTGGFATALAGINKLKMAMATLRSVGVWNTIKAGLASLSGPLSGVTGAVMGLAGSIVTGLTGAWAIAGVAAKDANVQMASDNYTTGEIIKGIWLTMGESVSGMWSKVSKFLTDSVNWVAQNFGVSFSGIGEFAAKTAFMLSYAFTTAFEGIIRGVIGVGSAVKTTLTTAFSAVTKAKNGDWSGAAGDALSVVTGRDAGQGFEGAFAGYGKKWTGDGVREAWGNLGRGAGAVSGWLGDMGAKGRAANEPPALPKLGEDAGTRDIASLYAEGNAADQYDPNGLLQKPKEKPGKKKKGPKAKTPEQLYKAEETYLNKLAAKADDIMKRFAEDDPIAKLTSDYVTDVTEQAQRLLTNDAFKKWKDGLQADAKDGVIAVTGLSAALKGTGVQQDVLAELSKRYGISVDDLTAKLNAQETAYQRNIAKQKEEMTFGATMLKTMQAESRMMLLSNRDQEVAAKLLEEVNRFKEKGWEITQKQIDATRQQIDAQVKLNETMARQKAFFDNNGVRNYVNDTRTLGEAVNDMDRNALQNLEDTLHTLGTTGKLSFKSLIDGMQSDIIRFAAQDITKSLVGRLFSNGELEGGTPSIMGGLMKTMGFGDYQKDGVSGPKLGESYANPMYVWSVNADGTLQVGGKAGAGSVIQQGIKALSGTAANDNAPYGANPLGLSVDGVAEAMNSEITSGITGSAQTMQSSFGGVIQGLGGMMGNIFGSIGNMLQSLIGGGAGGAGGGAGGGLGSLLGGGGAGGAGGLGGGLAGAGIGSMAGGLLGSLFGKKGKKWGSILGGVAGAAFGLGMFKEGGLTSSPVARGSMSASAFVNAPHYKEGTANTSGGIPAILHDNEAVIPLSRGRAVPVEVNGGSGGSGGNTQVINQNFNISTPNADSFRRSKQQIGTQMYVSSARAHRRNAGG